MCYKVVICAAVVHKDFFSTKSDINLSSRKEKFAFPFVCMIFGPMFLRFSVILTNPEDIGKSGEHNSELKSGNYVCRCYQNQINEISFGDKFKKLCLEKANNIFLIIDPFSLILLVKAKCNSWRKRLFKSKSKDLNRSFSKNVVHQHCSILYLKNPNSSWSIFGSKLLLLSNLLLMTICERRKLSRVLEVICLSYRGIIAKII